MKRFKRRMCFHNRHSMNNITLLSVTSSKRQSNLMDENFKYFLKSSFPKTQHYSFSSQSKRRPNMSIKSLLMWLCIKVSISSIFSSDHVVQAETPSISSLLKWPQIQYIKYLLMWPRIHVQYIKSLFEWSQIQYIVSSQVITGPVYQVSSQETISFQ